MTREEVEAKLAQHAANGDHNAKVLLAIRQGKVKLKSDRWQEWLRSTGQAK